MSCFTISNAWGRGANVLLRMHRTRRVLAPSEVGHGRYNHTGRTSDNSGFRSSLEEAKCTDQNGCAPSSFISTTKQMVETARELLLLPSRH